MTGALGWEPTEIDGIQLYQRNGRFDAGTPVEPEADRRFTKVVGLWAPRRWVTPDMMDVEGMVEEIEEIIRARGLITYDGQVITRLRRVGPWGACFEPVSIDTPLDTPERRPWGPEQSVLRGRAAVPDDGRHRALHLLQPLSRDR